MQHSSYILPSFLIANEDELGNRFSTRIEGTYIKHHMGKVAIKMYDKHAIVMRVETTANGVSFFKHYRKVEHRHGTVSRKVAPVRKTIYSLVDLRGLLIAIWTLSQPLRIQPTPLEI